MNNEKIFFAIGELSDDLIADAAIHTSACTYKRRTHPIRLSPLIAACLFILTMAIVVYAASTLYQTNDRGITYGHVNPFLPPEEQEVPELIAAIGLDGVEGYIYARDLDGDLPNTPEEAIEYMAKLELEIANAKAAGQEHFRYIPLYESDGITVIGTFGVPYPDE